MNLKNYLVAGFVAVVLSATSFAADAQSAGTKPAAGAAAAPAAGQAAGATPAPATLVSATCCSPSRRRAVRT